jgi:hypothetical protein
MEKLGTRHDELTASGAGHRFHAAEYRSGCVTDHHPRAADLAKRDVWTRKAITIRAALRVPKRCERAPRHFRPATRLPA